MGLTPRTLSLWCVRAMGRGLLSALCDPASPALLWPCASAPAVRILHLSQVFCNNINLIIQHRLTPSGLRPRGRQTWLPWKVISLSFLVGQPSFSCVASLGEANNVCSSQEGHQEQASGTVETISIIYRAEQTHWKAWVTAQSCIPGAPWTTLNARRKFRSLGSCYCLCTCEEGRYMFPCDRASWARGAG